MLNPGTPQITTILSNWHNNTSLVEFIVIATDKNTKMSSSVNNMINDSGFDFWDFGDDDLAHRSVQNHEILERFDNGELDWLKDWCA